MSTVTRAMGVNARDVGQSRMPARMSAIHLGQARMSLLAKPYLIIK